MVESKTVEEKQFSLLPDPIGDRTLKRDECETLANKPIEDTKLWKKDKIDWLLLKDFLSCEGMLTKV